jgi:hypothetical protein
MPVLSMSEDVLCPILEGILYGCILSGLYYVRMYYVRLVFCPFTIYQPDIIRHYVSNILSRKFALDSEHHGRHEKKHFNAIYHGKSELQLRNGHSRRAVMNSLVLLIHAIRAADVMSRLTSDRRPPFAAARQSAGRRVGVCVTHCLCDLATMFG